MRDTKTFHQFSIELAHCWSLPLVCPQRSTSLELLLILCDRCYYCCTRLEDITLLALDKGCFSPRFCHDAVIIPPDANHRTRTTEPHGLTSHPRDGNSLGAICQSAGLLYTTTTTSATHNCRYRHYLLIWHEVRINGRWLGQVAEAMPSFIWPHNRLGSEFRDSGYRYPAPILSPDNPGIPTQQSRDFWHLKAPELMSRIEDDVLAATNGDRRAPRRYWSLGTGQQERNGSEFKDHNKNKLDANAIYKTHPYLVREH
ncbi:hypothetical protein J6590_019216 [Homalodisca vitripennis]|nr:hypothetical protein J6590_019216 [Homalodisca vitripennis]